jgi:hypothetical protein
MESEQGAQEDCRTSSAAGAPRTGTRALALSESERGEGDAVFLAGSMDGGRASALLSA